MSVGGLLSGTHTLLVGVEEQDDGGVRLYLCQRSLGLYTLVYDEEAKERVSTAWACGRRLTVVVPPSDEIYTERPMAVPENDGKAA